MIQTVMAIPLIIIAVILLLPAILAQLSLQRNGHARALRLLKRWLSPEQLASYERFAFFDVNGSYSGRVFRIHFGTQTNIEELDNSGQPICRWCFVPVGNLAAGDVMLAQKIALETDEVEALGVANRLFGPQIRRVRPARRQGV